MDINPPKLGTLTVNGRLDFQDSGPRLLQVDNIVNWGVFNVGTPSAPFLNSAQIVFYGSAASPVVILVSVAVYCVATASRVSRECAAVPCLTKYKDSKRSLVIPYASFALTV